MTMFGVTLTQGQSITSAIVLLAIIIFCISYRKAPRDTALIISGISDREIIGRAGFRIPFLDRVDKLYLKLIPLDVKTENPVPTADYINISVNAAVNVKIGTSKEMLKLASQNFLNKSDKYIGDVAMEVLEGNMREIVGQMKLEAMVSDRAQFNELVRKNADPDLAAMGLEIITFNVQNFTDDNEVIKDLGIDNTEAIKKKAAIAKAESQRDIKISEAQADKAANEERVAADKSIAEQNTALEVRKAELKVKEDTQRALADAAYRIQEEKSRKDVEVMKQEADIAKQQKEIERLAAEADAKEKELDAAVRKQAEADKFAALQQADADLYKRKKDAEAAKYEAEQAAEARKKEAEGIRAVGEAEAYAIQAKGEAEAAAMNKKAEAYQKYNKAAVAEMLINVLPEMAGKIAEPLTQIDKITIIGGNSDGVGEVAGNVPAVMAKLFESVKETVGIDLGDIMRAGTYDAKVNRNVNFTGLPKKIEAEIGEDGTVIREEDVEVDTVPGDDDVSKLAEEQLTDAGM